MKAAASLFAFLFLLFSPAQGFAEPDEAARALELARKAYESLTGLKARFTQTDERPGVGVTVSEDGVLYFKPPDRMRWEYGGKRPHTVVLDGSRVWIHTPSRNQVILREITPDEMRKGAATFLGGLDGIEEDFTLQSRPTPPGDAVPLEMFPIGEDFPYERLSVLISPGSGLIERISVFHKLGNITTITFHDIRTGVSVPEGLFALDVPKGTEVIEP